MGTPACTTASCAWRTPPTSLTASLVPMLCLLLCCSIDYLEDPLKFMAALESLAFCDYSLAIKTGV